MAEIKVSFDAQNNLYEIKINGSKAAIKRAECVLLFSKLKEELNKTPILFNPNEFEKKGR